MGYELEASVWLDNKLRMCDLKPGSAETLC